MTQLAARMDTSSVIERARGSEGPRPVSEPPVSERPVSEQLLMRLAGHRVRFLAFVRSRVSTDADAEDIVQQGFARAAEKLSELRDPDRAVAWFYRVLRRIVADQHARRALGARKLDWLATTMEGATPEETASCACALGILDRLRPEYADILRRIDLDDQALEAAAAELGITVNNTSVRLHRARHRLRDEVESICGPGLRAARRACADCECPLT